MIAADEQSITMILFMRKAVRDQWHRSPKGTGHHRSQQHVPPCATARTCGFPRRLEHVARRWAPRTRFERLLQTHRCVMMVIGYGDPSEPYIRRVTRIPPCVGIPVLRHKFLTVSAPEMLDPD